MASIFWPDLAEHSMKSIPFFLAKSNPSSQETALLSIHSHVLEIQISFVANEHEGDLVVGVTFGLIQPFAYIVECLSAGDVVDQNHADGSTIV